MRSRQHISDIFSTYICFEAGQFNHWLADSRLKRSIERYISQALSDEVSKHVLALYWHQHWQNKTHRLACGHLGAYLQEAGYRVAYDLTARFELKQFSLGDCFQVAFAELENGLDSYNPVRGMTIESFAKLFFKSTITNELRRTKELDLCSDWQLLRRSSRKRFIEALKRTGVNSAAIEQYRLAWMCFQRLYAPHTATGIQQLPPPTPETWQAITDLYNRERLAQLVGSAQSATVEQLEEWLTNCIKWLRAYVRPAIGSINASLPGAETGELQDTLADDELPLLEQWLEEFDQLSRQDERTRLRQFLENMLRELDTTEQSLLQLYYQQNLTQNKIAKQLGLQQYKVSRLLTRVRKKLLNFLIDWGAEAKSAKPTPSDIKEMTEILEVWLRNYFAPNSDSQ